MPSAKRYMLNNRYPEKYEILRNSFIKTYRYLIQNYFSTNKTVFFYTSFYFSFIYFLLSHCFISFFQNIYTIIISKKLLIIAIKANNSDAYRLITFLFSYGRSNSFNIVLHQQLENSKYYNLRSRKLRLYVLACKLTN